jgi:hypothetical protein
MHIGHKIRISHTLIFLVSKKLKSAKNQNWPLYKNIEKYYSIRTRHTTSQMGISIKGRWSVPVEFADHCRWVGHIAASVFFPLAIVTLATGNCKSHQNSLASVDFVHFFARFHHNAHEFVTWNLYIFFILIHFYDQFPSPCISPFFMPGKVPLYRCKSEPQMVVAVTWIITSVGSVMHGLIILILLN